MREVDILKTVTAKAGEMALDMQKRDLQIWEKSDDQGPVTNADLAVNDFLKLEFSKHFPEVQILSEEDEDNLERLRASQVIVMDPIDGTKAYISGQSDFSISVALIEDGEPVIGVVVAPARGELYFASKGKGAFCNDAPIKMKDAPTLETANILASKARYNRVVLDQLYKPDIHFRPSIALRLALVARGDFDLSLALRPSWDWDIAAGHCLITEAGGEMRNRHGQKITYNQEIPQQDGIVAAKESLIETVIGLMEGKTI